MAIAQPEAGIAAGYAALATGDWSRARQFFEDALAVADSPEALDGLSRALWWLRQSRAAVVQRERAYAGFRREGDFARAARIALWLSREYALVFDNTAASRGWLARAERLLKDVAPGAEQGWLDLARSERARDAEEAAAFAEEALGLALHVSDTDLELRALAQLGYAEVSLGRVEQGLARLDEAMAATTSGEQPSLETFADICCTLILACDVAGDTERPKEWWHVLEQFVRDYDHVTLLAFCRTCCADVFAANGRVDAAEEELVAAIRELTEAGQRSRCVHPAVKLAEIRVLQGRFDEAEQLLTDFEGAPESVPAAVELRLARGEAGAAAQLLEGRIREVGKGNLLAAPLLAQLVEARLLVGDLASAREAAAGLEALADENRRDRVDALVLLAGGRIAAVEARETDAADLLRSAVNAFAALGLRLDAAHARLELARALTGSAPDAAVDVARRARNDLEALGATRDADAAAALMRSLGATGRAGPKAVGSLSRRELEVLRLLGEGLSNRALAERLFISPKTAEHHVGRVYAKLGLASRAEAAAFAVRHLA